MSRKFKGYCSGNKNTVLIILNIIMAVVLGILMWGEKKKSYFTMILGDVL